MSGVLCEIVLTAAKLKLVAVVILLVTLMIICTSFLLSVWGVVLYVPLSPAAPDDSRNRRDHSATSPTRVLHL